MRRRCALILLIFASLGPADAGTSTIVVSDAWSRPATGTAVVYVTLRNRGAVPDNLVGASSPLARRVELHESSETKASGMSMSMGNMPMGGSMMSMKSVSSIPIPALGTTSLSPGGYHLMLDLRRDIKAGEIIPLRLHFVRSGWIVTSARVRPIR
jgi:periplasmic copper chaperone A